MLTRLRNFLGIETRSAPAPSSWDLMRTGGIETDAGVPVSPHIAENLSAVFACVQIIAETVATLPLVCYRRTGDRIRSPDPAHPVSRLFSGDPNENQTAPEFIEMMTAHCLLRGNSYAEIVRDTGGQPVQLVPFHPDWVSVVRFAGTRRVAYDVSMPEGGTRRLLPDEMLHLKDRSDDGIVGKSRLHRARETFGTAAATERFAASMFRNGAALSGVLSHPGEIGEEAATRLRKSFEQTYAGSDKAGKIAVLEEGLKWQAISVSAEDAQMLESRRLGVENIARIYRVPPPVLGDLTNGSYSNVTELGRWFYAHTIQPWLVRWEKLIERSLFSEAGRASYEVEFDTDLLLRGDMLARFQSYRIAREIGLYNANELRQFEKQNPRTDPAGNEYFAPANMQQEQTGAPKDTGAANA
jgi:HK97 family phage portal protein